MAVIEKKAGVSCTEERGDLKVWDIAVRLFHWFLVFAFTIAWITGDEWDRVHEAAGYIVAGLVGLRILWGFLGSRHARFADFVYSPKSIFNYLRETLHHNAKRYLGHNPAGGAMVIALLISLFAATASGILMTTDAFWGVEWVEEIHEAIVNFVLFLVFLHVAGVIHSSFVHRENLVRSMINGRKRRGSDQ